MANDSKIVTIKDLFDINNRYHGIDNNNNNSNISQEMDLSSFTEKKYE